MRRAASSSTGSAPRCRAGGRAVAPKESYMPTQVLYLLFAFAAIGLFSKRLDRWTYPVMLAVIVVYVYWAYSHSAPY